jgi:hypothetical protein
VCLLELSPQCQAFSVAHSRARNVPLREQGLTHISTAIAMPQVLLIARCRVTDCSARLAAPG